MSSDSKITKEDVIKIVSSKIKIIRAEMGFSQDEMAELLGFCKKTLVQIEKGRVLPNWTVCIAFCSLFRDSEVLQATFGGDPLEVVQALSRLNIVSPKEKTWGGRIWWKMEKQFGRFRLQKNLISGHYRILDDRDFRWCSSYDRDYMLNTLKELEQQC